jgi:kinesin family protein 6/9
MIATLAVEDHLIEESISTSRFAQRVALISNSATLNEEMDPNQLISSLRKEIVMLKTEIAILRGESGDSEALADYEKQKIKEAVDRYISDKLEDSLTISSFQKMQYAFKIMKAYLLEKPADSKFFIRDYPNEAVRTDNNSADANKLQQLIAHRDNEISSLV